MIALFALLSGLLAVLVTPWCSRRGTLLAGLPGAVHGAAVAGWAVNEAVRIGWAQATVVTVTSVEALGFAMSFRIDGLSLLMAALVGGIGACVHPYAASYLSDDAKRGRFLAVLTLFQTAMLGLVFCENMLLLYLFWEATSLTSFALVAHKEYDKSARAGARQALIVTSLGGAALLLGILMIGVTVGSFELSAWLRDAEMIRTHAIYLPALVLLLIGAATKSAQFPFHFWLPNAMSAPAPASAFLHSATLVKAGVFLVARMQGVLGNTLIWTELLIVLGSSTMVAAALLTLSQTLTKRMLAYSTVWALGVLMVLLGIGSEKSIEVAVLFLIAHALYKSALFLVAGVLEHSTGQKQAEPLGRLFRKLPWTAVAAAGAGISMAGLPPSVGFVAKEMMLDIKTSMDPYAWALGLLAVLTGATQAYVALRVAWRPFWGGVAPTTETHPVGFTMLVGPLLLASLGLLFGLFSWPLAEPLLSPATSAAVGREVRVKLYLWHGLNVALMLSLATVLIGLFLFRNRDEIAGALSRPLSAMRLIGPEGIYQRALKGFLGSARRLGGNWIPREPGRHLAIIALATAALPLIVLYYYAAVLPQAVSETAGRPVQWLLLALAVAAAVATLRLRDPLAALAAMAIAGYSVCLFFLESRAPDLALTQFLVDTLLLFILLAVLLELIRFGRAENTFVAPRLRAMYWLTGGAFGLAISATVLLASVGQRDLSHKAYFSEQSVPAAHGGNVVNVILVDFRALDTLGEIAVVGLAGLAIAALLRGYGPAGAGDGRSPRVGLLRPSPLLQAAASAVVPALLVVAALLFLQGHNRPGGGFAGGLVTALALILRELVGRSPRFTPSMLVGVGLTLALVAGVWGVLAGGVLLQGIWWSPVLPWLGKLHLGTPLLFDLGVLILVSGAAWGAFRVLAPSHQQGEGREAEHA